MNAVQTMGNGRALDRLWTVAELADAARLSAKTVRNRIYAGKQPQPIRVAGRLRFRDADVRAFLAGEMED